MSNENKSPFYPFFWIGNRIEVLHERNIILAQHFSKTYLEAMCIRFISVFPCWLIFGGNLGLYNPELSGCNWGSYCKSSRLYVGEDIINKGNALVT